MTSAECSRRTLATGDFALVERCSCGCVHITIGAVTLRLAASAIGPLADTLSEAATALIVERTRDRPLIPEVLS